MKYIAITAGNKQQFDQYLIDKKIERRNGLGFKDDDCYVYICNVYSACGYKFSDHISVGTDYENANNRDIIKLIKMNMLKR